MCPMCCVCVLVSPCWRQQCIGLLGLPACGSGDRRSGARDGAALCRAGFGECVLYDFTFGWLLQLGRQVHVTLRAPLVDDQCA
jgi:hypothetical protein